MHASWAFFCGLVFWFMITDKVPAAYPQSSSVTQGLVALLVCLLMLGSVVLHEGAHVAVSRLLGIRLHRVVLFPFGGIREAERQNLTGRAQLLQAGIGSLFSLTLGIILTVTGLGLDQPLAAWLGVFNLALGAWNLVPAEPLDGIGLLHVLARKWGAKATKVTRFGFHAADTLSVLLVWVGLPVTILASFTGGMLLILYGSLLQIANNVYLVKQDPRRWSILHTTEVGQVISNSSPVGMGRAIDPLRRIPTGHLPAQGAQKLRLTRLNGAWRANGDGAHLPAAPRPPLNRCLISADARLVDALEMLEGPGAPPNLLVVDDHQIIGVCSRDDLLDHVRPERDTVKRVR